VFKTLTGLYLANNLHWTDESEALQRLRSGARQRLIVPQTSLRTIGDRAFGVAASRVWNSLPPVVTSASSLQSFKRQLKTFLFKNSFFSFSFILIVYHVLEAFSFNATLIFTLIIITQMQAATKNKKPSCRRDRATAAWVSQFWPKYNWKRIFFTEPYRSIFNHCDVIIGLLVHRFRRNNAK